MTIQTSGGLSDDQIKQMVNEGEQFAEKDKERRALVDVRNEADAQLYSTQNSVKEYKG